MSIRRRRARRWDLTFELTGPEQRMIRRLGGKRRSDMSDYRINVGDKVQCGVHVLGSLWLQDGATDRMLAHRKPANVNVEPHLAADRS